MSNDKTWDDDKKFAFEAWKYYGGIGGADKNRMIQIVTWLLGFSAAIIGFYASGKLTEPVGNVLLIGIGILVSILAAFVALLYGGYAARNWSIADRIACKYDWTEQKPGFDPFLRWASFKITEKSLKKLKSKKVPDDVLNKLESIKNNEFKGDKEFLKILKTTIGDEQTDRWISLLLKHALMSKPRPWTAAFSLRLAKPCGNRIAPVFWIFFWISVGSFAVHVYLLYAVLASNGCDCSCGGGV